MTPTTCSEAQGVSRQYRLFVVSCVLALVCSATTGEECSSCAPVDGRCPPGFLVSGDSSCVCGSKDGALPIDRCDEQHCRAYLRSGYWAGYVSADDDTNGSRSELYTGKCPRGFCKIRENGAPPLPGLSNSSNLTEELNQVVCGTTRKGLLCGECSPGFGPGVNLLLAPCVHCATDPLSQVGWLLWLLLEVLPLLLMLVAFLIFDINLLAGPLNSYLLYAQFIAASWPISSVGPIKLDNSARSVFARFSFVVFFGIFDLQFFSFLLPPFCITPSAANLDQLDMILITALTRLLPFIIILSIITLQWCNHYGYCRVLLKCRRYIFHRCKVVRFLIGRISGQSAAHGLSAFFILVYTRFLGYWGVLCDRNVIEPSNTSNASAIAVLEFQGSLSIFEETKHIVVTVIILLLSIFMILLPTCLLLAYPALPQLQAKLQHSKYKVVRCVSGLKCLNIFSRPSIQHFGDLFQSSYKDNCRFFAGVLLLVRIMLVVAWNISGSKNEGYMSMIALSLAVLTLHSLLRPHQSRWINVVDSLMYAHLVAVNLLAVYIFSNLDSPQSSVGSWMTLYQFALFAPGAYPVLYVANVLCKRWRRCSKRPSTVMSVQAAGDDGYVHIEHVVEVDPQVEEDPVREGVQEVEKSYGSVAERNSRYQELWFNDN